MAQARGDAGLSAESGGNTATFEAINDAYFRGDFDAAWELIHPQIEWVEDGIPGAGIYHGHDGVRESLTKFVGTWEDYRVEHSELTESDDRLFLRARITGKGKASGVPVELDQFQVWTFRDGKAVRMQMFFDEAEARRAAGLETRKEAG